MKIGKICEKQQIMREYAINDKICENMRDFEKYAKSHVPHLNSALEMNGPLVYFLVFLHNLQ